RRAALALPMLARPLLEWTMFPADDDDLRARIDVLDAAVVVPIAVGLVESSECVLLRELLGHRLLPLKIIARSEAQPRSAILTIGDWA
ncbi:MAG: hypothetical protein QGI24_10160, partial [Kiritimatiellia bacterium]|nr:hypothetical protein [Kiritimatiellia bacterium]